MKRALLLNAVNPNIRGILALGHRGTAKSTSIRALADLLPRIEMVPECPYHCAPDKPAMLCGACVGAKPGAALPSAFTKAPVTDLPLGATEDRVCGTLDIERALSQGQKAFEPGLLAKANRGFLYIDEVNLLEDHLVDLLLDSAASGINVVEREGISIVHPAKFTLIGSGNPEEGELRPQLLDRFGLMAEIRTITDLDTRVEIVKRRTEFERDPVAFNQKFEDDQSRLRERVVAARAALDSVEVPDSILRQIAQLCVELEVDGHRGELTLLNASLAQAAFEGHERIEEADVVAVATLALRHRLRKDPLDRTDSGDKIRRAVEKVFAPAAPTQAREAGAHA
jgi:magnesium chelatase subunit I